MNRIALLYNKLYDFDNCKFTLGGIQTYVINLISICKEMNIYVEFFQMGDSNNNTVFNGIVINQINAHNYQEFSNKVKELTIDNEPAIVYCTETIVPQRVPFKKAMAIQHGIYWDIPYFHHKSLIRVLASKLIQNYHILSPLSGLKQIVCVDYNYINWFRATCNDQNIKLIPIPNYTRIAPIYTKESNRINIIFARRLFKYRGTRIFTTAIKRILDEYSNVNVTVAGTGPDEGYMKQELSKYKNVEFITYKSEESLHIHANKHIAVVPTVGSEGTSLSLLEAMSAQCAVIASNVGGMTNIILDNYNGLLVNAGDSDDLYKAIKKLLDYPEDRERLSAKAYETVKQAFSYEKWAEKWKEVLSSFIETK